MDQKDKELEDLFRPLGEKSKLPSTALTTQYKKKKQGSWTESLPEMKFETKPPVKKRTPEEEALSEAFRKEMEARRNAPPRSEGPSLLEKAKRTVKGAIDVNVGRAQNDYSRMKRGYRELEKGF